MAGTLVIGSVAQRFIAREVESHRWKGTQEACPARPWRRRWRSRSSPWK